MSKTVLISGINGFIGSHLCEEILKKTDWKIIGVDKLSYSSCGHDRLRDIKAFDDKRVSIFTTDLTLPLPEGLKKEIGTVDYILNLASESHVDNSIDHPVEFVQNNVNLVLSMLEFARELKTKGTPVKKFIQFSTDEVYGTSPPGVNYQEGDRYNPGNPYSASKAMQECLCYAYSNTYKLPIQITNTMNVLGERQHPEKYLPIVMNKVLKREPVMIHSNKEMTKAGTRYYIHARTVANALLYLLSNVDELLDNIDSSKGKFHIVGEKEMDNLELAELIAEKMREHTGDENLTLIYKMVDFHSSRPGHDLAYRMSGKKIADMGWNHPVTIEDSISNIVKWTLKPENQKWLNVSK